MTPRVSSRADRRTLGAPWSLAAGEGHRGCCAGGLLPALVSYGSDGATLHAADHGSPRRLRAGERAAFRLRRAVQHACGQGLIVPVPTLPPRLGPTL